MHKFKNYDDEQNTFTAIISGKEFKISRIVHAVSVEYGEYMQNIGNYLLEVNRISEENKKITDPAEAGKIKLNTDKLNEMMVSFSTDQYNCIHAITEKILVQNGYEYSADWWDNNSTTKQMETFIVDCINKDVDEKANALPKKKE